jgi:hypothetical protein
MANDCNRSSGFGRGNETLPSAAKIWATPTVHGNYNRKGAGPESGDGLSTQATGRRARTTCTHGGMCRLMLNPRFVAWLMGFPISWLDDVPGCAPLETRSSLLSAKSSEP